MTRISALLTLLTALLLSVPAQAQDISQGQTVYVPCYSHVYQGVKARPFLLAVTLSVRNTDPRQKIVITDVDYYDTEGNLVRRFLTGPVIVPPLGTREYIVDENDKSGGSGANFIVRWRSGATGAAPVNEPIAEAVMIGTYSNQGISFVSRGEPVKDKP